MPSRTARSPSSPVWRPRPGHPHPTHVTWRASGHSGPRARRTCTSCAMLAEQDRGVGECHRDVRGGASRRHLTACTMPGRRDRHLAARLRHLILPPGQQRPPGLRPACGRLRCPGRRRQPRAPCGCPGGRWLAPGLARARRTSLSCSPPATGPTWWWRPSGLLDFVTFEDSLSLQSADRAEPDDRTDQVRGLAVPRATAARVAPLTRHVGLIPASDPTPNRSMSPRRSPPSTTSAPAAPGGEPSCPGPPRAPISAGRTDSPPVFRGDPEDYRTPEVQALIAKRPLEEATDFVEVSPPVVGQLGGRRRDPRRLTGRFIDHDKLHYIDFEGRWFNVRGPSITPGRRKVSRSCALAHGSAAYQLIGRFADLGYVTPQNAGKPTSSQKSIFSTGGDRPGRRDGPRFW